MERHAPLGVAADGLPGFRADRPIDGAPLIPPGRDCASVRSAFRHASEDGWLEDIVLEHVPVEQISSARTAPPTILANLLVNKVDGRRSPRAILGELRCGERALADAGGSGLVVESAYVDEHRTRWTPTNTTACGPVADHRTFRAVKR